MLLVEDDKEGSGYIEAAARIDDDEFQVLLKPYRLRPWQMRLESK